MMESVFDIITRAFSACAGWFTSLVNATGSGGVIIAAFAMCVVISLLFLPLRGSGIGDVMPDFTINKTYTKKNSKEKGLAVTKPGALKK